ncbi:protein MAK16 homolog [Dioscorea cayenensis subsp. rotundata]|uniref:Protein MAK16 homolog n=1 Tax=Dioscorea cayennensis subsp. rotundata TaxID=55577 RepID=A0AB40CSC5_DIOCR|nr:protein MAK16 homolog [Dioscorea cayenensis subsp. rotundata]
MKDRSTVEMEGLFCSLALKTKLNFLSWSEDKARQQLKKFKEKEAKAVMEGGEECSSSESGWTMYLTSPLHDDYVDYEDHEVYVKHAHVDDDHEDDDDSMASDASTGDKKKDDDDVVLVVEDHDEKHEKEVEKKKKKKRKEKIMCDRKQDVVKKKESVSTSVSVASFYHHKMKTK